MSPTVIKCAGAPQKIMWLLEDTLRAIKLRDRADIQFWTPGGAMFGVKRYSDQLEVIRQKRGVNAFFKQELVSIDVSKKIATFKNLETNELRTENYDFLHVAPHMSAPDFIKTSPFANTDGWMAVINIPYNPLHILMYLVLVIVQILQTAKQPLRLRLKLRSLYITSNKPLITNLSMDFTQVMHLAH